MLAQGENGWNDTLLTFGDAPGNKLSLPVVEAMLRAWHAREPEHMGVYVAEAIVGTAPKPKRRERV